MGGELCLIHNPGARAYPVKAEVVGFQDGDVLLMPLGDLVNVLGPERSGGHRELLTVKVGQDGLLGASSTVEYGSR